MAAQPILVSAGMDKTIRFWDIGKQENSFSLEYKDSQINAMCTTPDAKQLAIAAWQHVRVYSLQNPTPQGLHTFSVHDQKNVTAIGFEADGRWMYTAGEDGTAKIWDMRATQLNCQRIFQVKTPVHSVALHPNQSELIVADSTGVLYVWDLRTDIDDSLMTDVDISEYIIHVDIDKMGQQCAAVTNRGNLFIWNITRNEMNVSLPSMTATSKSDSGETHENSLELNSSQNMNATSGRTSRLTDEDEDDAAEEVDDEEENEDDLVTLPAETDNIRTAYERHEIANGKFQQQACATGSSMSPLAAPPTMIPDTPINGGKIRDYQPGFCNPNFQQNADATTHALTTPSQQTITRGQLPAVQSASTASLFKSAVKIRAHSTFALKCRFRPDSLVLATTSADQTTKSWSVTNHKLLNTYTVPRCRWVWDCAFTNDSKHMLTASSDGILRMWEMDSREVVCNLKGHSLGITAMTFRDVA